RLGRCICLWPGTVARPRGGALWPAGRHHRGPRGFATCALRHDRRVRARRLLAFFPEETMPYARITGTGSYLPPRIVTNDDLAADLATRGVETSDAWIVERTGIRQRHIADPGVKTST